MIAGRAWPKKIASPRDKLIVRIKRERFAQTLESIAYTWFNRFAALRYMELHDYLEHGDRVLSNRNGALPEILEHGAEIELPGSSANKSLISNWPATRTTRSIV
jgi:hypothetical protein